jgi:hypothetical protein
MNYEFRVTKLLMELHYQVAIQVEKSGRSGAFMNQNKKVDSVREIRNQGFFSDLEKYFASSSNEQKAFFDGEEIFLQEEKVERNLDTLQVSFVSPLLAGTWVRVIDRENRTPVALAEVLPNRRGAIAEIRLPFQAREDDFRFFLTSDPLQAKDQTPLTVRIRAIREGQIAAQRERAADSIGAAWHWLHCSNLWKIIDEPSTAKTAARWAKSQFERGKSEQMSEPDEDEDEDISNPIDFGPFRSSNQDVLGYGLPSFSKNFSISNITSDGFSSKGSNRRNVKAKAPSKTTFLTDTAWSVLDDLGL